MGLQCLACCWSTTVALVSAVSVELTSPAAPPSEPAGSRDPTVQPLRSYNIWNTAIGSGAVWSNTGDPDTQAIIGSASGATINSGCWSIPVYMAKTSDPFGYFAAQTRNIMPINNGYYTQLAPDVLPSCGRIWSSRSTIPPTDTCRSSKAAHGFCANGRLPVLR